MREERLSGFGLGGEEGDIADPSDCAFQATAEKRLSFLYLANDMLQNGRKKAPELAGEFYRVLPRALKAIQRAGVAKDIEKAKR